MDLHGFGGLQNPPNHSTIHIIIFHETWLSPETCNAILGLNQYNVYRCDRYSLASSSSSVYSYVNPKAKNSISDVEHSSLILLPLLFILLYLAPIFYLTFLNP